MLIDNEIAREDRPTVKRRESRRSIQVDADHLSSLRSLGDVSLFSEVLGEYNEDLPVHEHPVVTQQLPSKVRYFDNTPKEGHNCTDHLCEHLEDLNCCSDHEAHLRRHWEDVKDVRDHYDANCHSEATVVAERRGEEVKMKRSSKQRSAPPPPPPAPSGDRPLTMRERQMEARRLIASMPNGGRRQVRF